MAKIVKFSNGRYGIQTSRFPRRFLCLSPLGNNRISIGDRNFAACLGDLEQCQRIFVACFPKVVKIINYQK